MNDHRFTFKHYKHIFQEALDNGYKIVSCLNYYLNHKEFIEEKILINRVDIDLSLEKAKKAAEIFNELHIDATFFVRLHGREYNPFSFENYLCLRYLCDYNFEVGLHSEIIDCEKIWNIRAENCLKNDIKILSTITEKAIFSVASHGGITGYNNLDFWKTHSPRSYGLAYEAYDPILFNNFYTSDSLITKWKCYNNGKLVENDNRCICDHLKENHKVIYCLTHPGQYYERHVYES